MMSAHWLDRLTVHVAPLWTLRRQRARLAGELIQRNYEGAASGYRTKNWRRSNTDPNQAVGPFIARLREVARDLVRNNPYAESAVSTICDHAVGWGIVAKPKPDNARAAKVWKAWAETTACDADGRHDFYGLQKLIMRAVVESGEVLVRRRFRRPEDGFPIPLQLQVLEPDFLDTSKDSLTATGGHRIIQGVEFDAIGRRVAYWLFPEHPGSSFMADGSVRVSADNVLHIFKGARPGQVRGASWFAPVLLRFKDFDEFEDATLMKQKIAACLAVITTDTDGTAAPIGETTSAEPEFDGLFPGMIHNAPPGRGITVVDPPTVREYPDYIATNLRAIATGLGVTYEDLTGNYENLPFSAARMSRLRHWARVEDWRWRLIIPQFCDPVWAWAMEVAGIFGVADPPGVEWTAPPAPMIDPVNEGLAYMRNVRAGIMTLSEALRERGYDPATVLKEIAADNTRLDDLAIILDSDPRKMTQAGQLQGAGLPTPAEPVVVAAIPTEPASGEARAISRRLGAIEAALTRPQPTPEVHVDARSTIHVPPTTIAPGAVQVDARSTVHASPVTIAEGAIQAPVTVQSPPPAQVTIADGAFRVDARTTVADGAVRVEPSPPAIVTIAEGAVQAPITVQAPAHAARRSHKRTVTLIKRDGETTGAVIEGGED